MRDDYTYTDSDSLNNDWVPIKRPAIPDEMLPNPEYDRDDYHILILSEDEGEQPVFYRDGATFPLSPESNEPAETFEESPDSSASEAGNESSSFEGDQPTNDPTDQSGSEPTREMANGGTSHKSGTGSDDSVSDDPDGKETPNEELGGKDEGVAAFAAERLVQSEDGVVPITAVYPEYEEYIAEHAFEKRRKNQFSRSLKKAVDYDIETDRVEIDGSSTARYLGVDMLPQ